MDDLMALRRFHDLRLHLGEMAADEPLCGVPAERWQQVGSAARVLTRMAGRESICPNCLHKASLRERAAGRER